MSDTVTLFVAAGHTVAVGEPPVAGGSPERRGPGETVTLPREEAERLRGLGFLQDTPPTIEPPRPANPAGIGGQSWQGPDYGKSEDTGRRYHAGPVYTQAEQR